MMSLLKLSKNSELTIARASGLNIWYCCLPHIILAFLIVIFSITVFSSITAVTQKKLAQLESEFLNKYNNNLQLSGGGFWLYQKEEDTFFAYAPKKVKRKIFNKKIDKENPFGVLKNLNLS